MFREVNRAIREMGLQLELASYKLFCECEDADCAERIEVPAKFYDEILGWGSRFVVLPGHEPVASADATFVRVPGPAPEPDALTAA